MGLRNEGGELQTMKGASDDMFNTMDWDAIWGGDLSSVVPHADERLEVVTIPGKGRGVRATLPVPAGTLLLAERALATAAEPELAGVLEALQGSLDTTRQPPKYICPHIDKPSLPMAGVDNRNSEGIVMKFGSRRKELKTGPGKGFCL